MSEVIANGDDLRTARATFGGYCASGTSAWFKRHGLSFRKFMTVGLPAESLKVDELGRRVAAIAEERAAQ